jgi:hypothetical protein
MASIAAGPYGPFHRKNVLLLRHPTSELAIKDGGSNSCKVIIHGSVGSGRRRRLNRIGRSGAVRRAGGESPWSGSAIGARVRTARINARLIKGFSMAAGSLHIKLVANGRTAMSWHKSDLTAVLNWATGITCAYQRRAAKVNEPLVAERMVGNAVFGSRGCDPFSAINVTT